MKSTRGSFRTDDGQENYLHSAHQQRSANQASISTPFTYNSPHPQYTPNTNQVNSDDWEYTVLKFGSEISLRGRLGKYLTAVPISQPIAAAAPVVPLGIASTRSSFSVAENTQTAPSILIQTPAAAPVQQMQAFLLGVEGQGVGELFDCFVFVNADNRCVNQIYLKRDSL